MFADCCFELTDDPSLLSRIRNDRSYQTALRERDGGQAARPAKPVITKEAVVQNVQNVQAEPVQAPVPAENKEHVMRIHYDGKPDSKGFSRLLNFLAYFHGNMAVEILFESDNSITRLDDICRIAPDEAVLNKLAELVGADNIEML